MAIGTPTSLGSNKTSTTLSTTITLKTSAAVTAGNRIVVAVAGASGSASTVALSGGGLTWTKDVEKRLGIFELAFFSAPAPAGLTKEETLTATFSVSSEAKAIMAVQVSGLGAADKTGAGVTQASSGKPWEAGTVEETGSEGLVFGFGVSDAESSTPTAGWTELFDFFDTPEVANCTLLYSVKKAKGSYNPGGELNKSASVRLGLSVTYKAAESLTPVSRELSSSYALKRRVTKEASSSYALRKTIAHELASPSAIRRTVARELSSAYALRNAVARQLTSSYGLRAAVTHQLASSYELRALVTNQLSSSAAIRAFVSRALSSSYEILVEGFTPVSRELSSLYAVRARVHRELSSTYAIRRTVARELVGGYSVLGARSRTLSSSYALRGRAARELSTSYDLESENVVVIPGQGEGGELARSTTGEATGSTSGAPAGGRSRA